MLSNVPALHISAVHLSRTCPLIADGVSLSSFADRISWYACVGFYFGGILFIIGSFAGISPAVGLPSSVTSMVFMAN